MALLPQYARSDASFDFATGDDHRGICDPIYDALKDITTPGTFATGGPLSPVAFRLAITSLVAFVDAGLFVEDVGAIELPVTVEDAQKLVRVSRLAPYGRSDQTILDTAVRDKWQVDVNRVSFGPAWHACLEGAVRKTKLEMSLGSDLDTEKSPGHLTTFVLSLPSRHQGGTTIVSYKGTVVELDTARMSDTEVPSCSSTVLFYYDISPSNSWERKLETMDLVAAVAFEIHEYDDFRRASLSVAVAAYKDEHATQAESHSSSNDDEGPSMDSASYRTENPINLVVSHQAFKSWKKVRMQDAVVEHGSGNVCDYPFLICLSAEFADDSLLSGTKEFFSRQAYVVADVVGALGIVFFEVAGNSSWWTRPCLINIFRINFIDPVIKTLQDFTAEYGNRSKLRSYKEISGLIKLLRDYGLSLHIQRAISSLSKCEKLDPEQLREVLTTEEYQKLVKLRNQEDASKRKFNWSRGIRQATHVVELSSSRHNISRSML
ncbi:hypothetical protein EK21DRAFT_92160 [Setomelanomma holmii]|uniref:Uncharacterized protein n=1 Tax=Setomelanomma holmii TaxID=210430 RepID=A0A9P4H2G6_9PLEO|nr:hypothetical protein EK21DRAFT_92160 [Setomelanomma holmii]